MDVYLSLHSNSLVPGSHLPPQWELADATFGGGAKTPLK
jgi:hypothetical protein